MSHWITPKSIEELCSRIGQRGYTREHECQVCAHRGDYEDPLPEQCPICHDDPASWSPVNLVGISDSEIKFLHEWVKMYGLGKQSGSIPE